MQNFKGRLLYMGWFFPWKLVTEKGEIDLWSAIDNFLASLSSKRAADKGERDSYTLAADEGSEYLLKYIPGKYVLLEKLNGLGASNVFAAIDDSLVHLSGRMVEIEIEDGKHMTFSADKSEKVYGVYFVGKGNSCEVPSGAEKEVCKIGESECCIFLSVGGDGQFHCQKFSSMARLLLDRLAKGEIRASRIGSCEVLGRKGLETAAV